MKKTLLILFIFTATLLPATDFYTASGARISFEKFDQYYYQIKKLISALDSTVSVLLGKSSRTNLRAPYAVTVLSGPVKNNIELLRIKGIPTILLSNNLPRWLESNQVKRSLAAMIMLARADLNPEKNLDKIPDWLLTAVLAEAENRSLNDTINPVPWLPGAKALHAVTAEPDVYTILEQPLRPTDGAAFKVYSDCCRLLLEEGAGTARKSRDDTFGDMLALAVTGKYSQEEIFESTLGRVIRERIARKNSFSPLRRLDSKAQVNAWFAAAIKKRYNNIFNPTPVAKLKKRFTALLKIECKIRDKEAHKTITFALDQLPFYRWRLVDPALPSQLSGKIIELSNSAPPLLRSPLFKLTQTISSAKGESPDRDAAAISLAIGKVNAALKKQQRIETYLEVVAQKKLSPLFLYRQELESSRRYRSSGWPLLDAYLTEVEKKYLD